MLDADRLLSLVRPGSSPLAALAQGLYLARVLRAELVVTSAVPLPDTPALETEALATLVERFASDTATESDPLVTVSDPPESVGDLQDDVRATDVDLVVTDTVPGPGSTSVLNHPPTRELIERLPCPIFVAGPAARPSSFGRILVPTDLSDHALEALEHAVGLAAQYDASVDVLHVIDTIPYVALTPRDRLSLTTTSLPEHRARRRVEAFRRAGPPARVPVRTHLAHGRPAAEIQRFVEAYGTDLLVLPSHGKGTHPNRPLAPVAERLLRRWTGALFLVRAFGHSLVRADDRSN